MAFSAGLESFLRKARRRHLLNQLLNQSVIALSAAAAGGILLLLLGTEILNWYWLLLLFAGSLALGIYRTRKAVPSAYVLAQRIDRTLEMRDGLSTAYHFRDGDRPGLPVLQSQLEGRLMDPEQVERAVPIVFPRTAYSLAGLMAIVGGLFAVRYGITHTLDVRAPIAHFSFGMFSATASARETPKKSAIQERLDEQLKQMGLSLEQIDSPPGEGEKSTDRTLPTVLNQDGRNPVSAPEKGKNISNKPDAGDGGDPVEGSEKAEGGTPGENNEPGSQQQDGSPGSPQQGPKPQTPPSGSKAASNNSNEGNSVLDKMRDAMSNLLSKLKTPSKPQDSRQGSAQAGNAPSKQPQANQKGMQGQSKTQGEGQAATDQQGDQDSDSGDKSQTAQGKAGDKSSDKPGNQDSKSGQGKQDGDKAIHDAEQLAAMGKISELLGKRAAQVTGEMTVEVPSGKQQLKTLYSQKKALHADAGSDVNRDEIPLIYQPYIQRYYEELRKSPAKTKN